VNLLDLLRKLIAEAAHCLERSRLIKEELDIKLRQPNRIISPKEERSVHAATFDSPKGNL
jgi:hypothetical protein